MIASFREREIVWGLKIPIVDALASYRQATGPWQGTSIASYNLNIEASFCVAVSHQTVQAHCPVKQIATPTIPTTTVAQLTQVVLVSHVLLEGD